MDEASRVPSDCITIYIMHDLNSEGGSQVEELIVDMPHCKLPIMHSEKSAPIAASVGPCEVSFPTLDRDFQLDSADTSVI